MGLNPGGGGNDDSRSFIQSNLYAPPEKNSYADECWKCFHGYECCHCESGKLNPDNRDIIQKRVCDLFAALGSQPKEIISTNLIFARSTESSKLQHKAEWIRRCWNIHRELLGIVRPTWVITLGFEAFSILARRSRAKEIETQKPVSEKFKHFGWHRRLEFDLGNEKKHEAGILGVPHPGNRGFNAAGLGGEKIYPDVLKKFVTEKVLG
jgi:hypothetical protein